MSEFDMPDKEIAKRLPIESKLQKIGLPVGLTPRQANAITQSRLQYALSELADMNVDNVNLWLQQVAERSPAEAIRLYMELLEFRMPRMKAAQVAVNVGVDGNQAPGQKRLQDMSIEELQSVVAEQG